MNSEKVKEIKEKLKKRYYYLDQAYSDHLAYGGKGDEQQEEEIYFLGDTLSLINEFESELEKEQINNLNCDTELQYKEKRIAELKKGNEALSFAVKQGFNDCQTKTLKQFAERLKEKVKNFCGTEYENAYYDVTKSCACNDIDETLKEFLL